MPDPRNYFQSIHIPPDLKELGDHGYRAEIRTISAEV
jgi:hypothetical protein